MKHPLAAALAAACLWAAPARADDSFAEVAQQVNSKMVKIFGSGGFRGLAAYGTGLIVSPDGYVLTISTPMLDTADLRVHLSDGRRYHAKVVMTEPELNVALVKIESKEKLELPFFDIAEAVKQPMAEPGSGVLAFSNQFEIATRDEQMSVQRGLIAAVSKLQGRRGIHEVTFQGNVYVIDAITNNPGAAGGVVTTRKGRLLGMIGKELRNELTNTWINHAIPIQTKAEVVDDKDVKRTISIAELVEKKEKYVVTTTNKNREKADNYHGITLVSNVVELTPPFVEDIAPESPGAKAGLQADDLIVYVDGEQVSSINELEKIFGRIRPNQEVKLEVRRRDKLTTLTLKMGEPLTKKKPRKPTTDKDD
jgi:S1-C subfamily serine protease